MPGSIRRLVRLLASVAVFLVICLNLSPAAASGSRALAASVLVPTGQAAPLPQGATVAGPLPGTQNLLVSVELAPRDPAQLESFIADVSTPGSPDYRHYLTTAEFAQRFGASAATVSAVDSYLRSEGLQPNAPTADGLFIPLFASASSLEQAFQMSLNQVQLSNGTTAFANTSPPLFPSAIAPQIQGVLGLTNTVQMAPEAQGPSSRLTHPLASPQQSGGSATVSPDTTGQSGVGPAASSCTTTADQAAASMAGASGSAQLFPIPPEDLNSYYGANISGDTGAGVTVALFEMGGFKPSNIAGYQTCAGTSTTVNQISVDGGPGVPSYSEAEDEVQLDIENVIGAAPGATIDVYEGPGFHESTTTDQNWIDTLAQIVDTDAAQVVSISYGGCESNEDSTFLTGFHNLFMQAAAQGQSVYVSSGDDGSESCITKPATTTFGNTALIPEYPGSDPYVTSVGGTLNSWEAANFCDANPSKCNGSFTVGEKVWNDPFEWSSYFNTVGSRDEWGGGGGISTLFSMPSWQSTSVPGVSNSYSNSTACAASGFSTGGDCREVPDVSADADIMTGYLVYEPDMGTGTGGWFDYGGTSGAAPLWAAYTALIDDQCPSGQGVGFANPSLYAIGANPTKYAADFNDVTVGNNDVAEYSNGTFANNGLYPATTGYDMGSGLGTPKVSALTHDLCSTLPTKPTVSAVSPNSGPTTGGTAITITGTGFVAGAKVVIGQGNGAGIGAIAATSVKVVSPTEITAVTGGGAKAGPCTLFVTTSGGTSAANAGAAFSYAVLPTVSKVSPNTGPKSGGTAITITGTGFVAGAKAVIGQGNGTTGAIAATSVKVVSPTEITAVTGGGAKVGTFSLFVTTSGGTSAANAGADFSYGVTVTKVSPNTGPTTGGTAITITGTGFVTGATVVIGQGNGTTGAIAATNVKVVSPTQITAVTGGGAKAGSWTLFVTTSAGTSAANTGADFTYS